MTALTDGEKMTIRTTVSSKYQHWSGGRIEMVHQYSAVGVLTRGKMAVPSWGQLPQLPPLGYASACSNLQETIML